MKRIKLSGNFVEIPLEQDYNGGEIPRKVKASDIEISVVLKYDGKHGKESHTIESCTLEDWCGIDDVLRNYKVEYERITQL